MLPVSGYAKGSHCHRGVHIPSSLAVTPYIYYPNGMKVIHFHSNENGKVVFAKRENGDSYNALVLSINI